MRRIFVGTALILTSFATSLFSEEVSQRTVLTPSRLETNLTKTTRSITIVDGDDFDISAYTSIPDIIGNVGGIDIRRRGPDNIQADVNMRGANFEENAVLIDGVKVNDPQTGHFDMDLPLTVMDVSRVEILKGPASSVYGPNSFGGVINIITRKPDTSEVIVDSAGGSYDYFRNALSVSAPAGPLKNRFSIEDSHSSGYMPETWFDTLTVSDSATLQTDMGRYDILFGYLKKDFGADGFYSNLFHNEEEHTDTRFFKIDGMLEADNLKMAPKIFLRRHRDKFMLDENRPGWQTNYSTNYNYGGELNFVLENSLFDTAYGFELSQDTIDSTNMQVHSRTKDGIYAEISPHICEKLNLNIGMREDYVSDFGWEYSPSAGINYRVIENITLRGGIARAFRIPTFTDLYYNDSANIGNPDLRPETSWTYEIGADYRKKPLVCSAAFFHRDSDQTIDWTRLSAADPWRVSNIGSISTNGLELSGELLPKSLDEKNPIDKVFFGYTVLDSYRKHDYLSKYALDYLKQQISCGIDYNFFGFNNSWVLNYKKRVGDSPFVVVDTKFTKNIFKIARVNFDAFLEVLNVFDTSYSEQSDVPMPGRLIRSGGRLRF